MDLKTTIISRIDVNTDYVNSSAEQVWPSRYTCGKLSNTFDNYMGVNKY